MTHISTIKEETVNWQHFKYIKSMSHCFLASIIIAQLDMLITGNTFTCLDGSDVPEVINRTVLRHHTDH